MIIASAQHAPDDLVFFLDADDIWADDHLAIVSAALGGPLAACDFVFTDKRDAEQAAPFRAGVMLAGECHVLGTTSLLHPRTLSSPIRGTRILSQDLAQDLGRGSRQRGALGRCRRATARTRASGGRRPQRAVAAGQDVLLNVLARDIWRSRSLEISFFGDEADLRVGAANRDPDAFPDPDTFRLDRRAPHPFLLEGENAPFTRLADEHRPGCDHLVLDAAALLIRHLLDVCRSIRIDRSQSVDMVCYTRTDGTRIQWPTNLRLVCGA